MTDDGIASRKGGARIEKEKLNGKVVVHNYGAGGAGYQASWYVHFIVIRDSHGHWLIVSL